MSAGDIRAELDIIIRDTESYDATLIPKAVLNNLNKWKWGSYGWVSPASLMFTAAWRKYYYPEVDCCKIWASDENNKPIPGGYSIRSEDEAISIPLLAKYDLCEGFCSPNSGMQGSRAIEKMRTLKRLNRDFDSAQRTLFDLKMFAEILNQINELNEPQLLELIKYFICTAKAIRAKRVSVNQALQAETEATFDLLAFLGNTADPEFTKCVTAACLNVLYRKDGILISGVDDFKTAADARARKPGDITLEKDSVPVIAVEVKDKTQHIDWNNIERAKRIMANHPGLVSFLFVLESRSAATNSLINEMLTSPQLATADGRKIAVMSLHLLYRMALAVSDENEIINITGTYLSIAPAVKPETKAAWLKLI